MAGRKLNGIGVGVIALSAFAIWAGVHNVKIIDGLRSILKGQTPTEGAQTQAEVSYADQVGTGAPASTGSGGGGTAIVDAARSQIGKPYRLGASVTDSSHFDCSSLVIWCLNKTGHPVPESVRRVRDIVRWDGVNVIPKALVAPGDLVAWDFVHIGIVSRVDVGGNPIYMINAPDFGIPVREQKVWSGVTHWLRVK